MRSRFNAQSNQSQFCSQESISIIDANLGLINKSHVLQLCRSTRTRTRTRRKSQHLLLTSNKAHSLCPSSVECDRVPSQAHCPIVPPAVVVVAYDIFLSAVQHGIAQPSAYDAYCFLQETPSRRICPRIIVALVHCISGATL